MLGEDSGYSVLVVGNAECCNRSLCSIEMDGLPSPNLQFGVDVWERLGLEYGTDCDTSLKSSPEPETFKVKNQSVMIHVSTKLNRSKCIPFLSPLFDSITTKKWQNSLSKHYLILSLQRLDHKFNPLFPGARIWLFLLQNVWLPSLVPVLKACIQLSSEWP